MAVSENLNFETFEEDDEFEEFPVDDWKSEDEDHTDLKLWEDNWDDDDVDDDFSKQLRVELEKATKSGSVQPNA